MRKPRIYIRIGRLLEGGAEESLGVVVLAIVVVMVSAMFFFGS